ncbi:unnamed protein product [Strongylus vulgaris]|uniref:Uncharacterized protein n=1 Tax=Strongylus vulgaris TaxID=40348 RepID=A0A3P7J3M8_STRVU|nr:unnamed protein product [Strongylus vulgaris]
MPPIRQPPAYQQLVEQGRIHRSRLGKGFLLIVIDFYAVIWDY